MLMNHAFVSSFVLRISSFIRGFEFRTSNLPLLGLRISYFEFGQRKESDYMKTIYMYLAWTGWIWFAIFGTYLFMKLRARRKSTEAKQPNEQ